MVTHSTAGDGGNRRASVFERLYIGNGAFDIVGKRMRWYVSLGLLVLVCIGAMGIKGFNLGIDFEGGTKLQVPAVGAQGPISEDQVQEAFTEALGHPAETVQLVGTASSQTIQVRTESLNTAQVAEVKETMFQRLQPLGTDGRPSPAAVSDSAVSGTWGGEITQQALLALGVFLVLVTVFLAFYFERWMAVAALIALLHDVVVTAGIYALTGFEVTPSTVIGLLTILGFSLYDTVVVFDKVKENTRGLLGLTRRTYPEAANLAVNQTLMRSINTSVIALLPVAGLLVVGAWLLGVGVLRDLALVQLVGMIAGVISSIFLATPLLVDFKMRDRKYRQQAAKVVQRRERGAAKEADEPADEQAEARPERPLAGASSAAGRRTARSDAPQNRRRPAGKSSRPTGKKRR
ncbi:protein translocase subunit SecF [Saccharopolyspora sp. NPDC047091]|uniref:protein translocase subunit SecF n=1 Tax=Saccharopolyspora sp. NPDC047091 TaxID=3155924 RepID=UPI0033CBD0D3